MMIQRQRLPGKTSRPALWLLTAGCLLSMLLLIPVANAAQFKGEISDTWCSSSS